MSSSKVTLFVGTRRGLFRATSDHRRAHWRIDAPRLEGREIFHVAPDPRRPGRVWAASAHAVWGAHVHRSDDGGLTWDLLEAAPHFQDARGLDAVWFLCPGPARAPDTLWAGIQPAGLFRSDDAGRTWQAVEGLNEHPSRPAWQPAGGALALHSVMLDPRDDRRVYAAVSAGGAFRSDDGGARWTPINRGVRAEFLPRRASESGQCVHKLLLHPARPDRLYQQNHCGVYRSDDRGDHWIEITADLPSDFGYALAVDPADADTAYVVPESSSHMRATIDGRFRVYRTRDAGASWQPCTEGLPQEHAWVSILREGMTTDTLRPCGVYVGTSSGHLFVSPDGGDRWTLVAAFLPRILAVATSVSD
jgi:photosystem II stability/assembly factor-like uncharacterized protein